MFGRLKASGLTKKQMHKIDFFKNDNYDSELKTIFGFKRIYNYSAYLLLKWAKNENNRIKAYKLIQQAIKLEKRHRKFYWFVILLKKDTGGCSFSKVIQYEPEYYKEL